MRVAVFDYHPTPSFPEIKAIGLWQIFPPLQPSVYIMRIILGITLQDQRHDWSTDQIKV